MSAMINLTKELPQNITAIQSEHTEEQYSKSSNEQRHLEAAFAIRCATCILTILPILTSLPILAVLAVLAVLS